MPIVPGRTQRTTIAIAPGSGRRWPFVEPDAIEGRYANENADAGPAETRVIYGDAKLARLAALKRAWDPDNVVPAEPQRGAGRGIELRRTGFA